MNKLRSLFRKKWFYLILVILTAFLFFILKNRNAGNVPVSQPGIANREVASFGEILPGKTSIDRVNELLGFPINTNIVDGKNLQDYRTSNEFRNHQVITENSLVKLIKEAVNIEDAKSAETIRNTYGIAPYILYEKKPSSVFDLYVYPENGIAYIGHEDGTILEIWYFEPTTIDDFISKWANDYSKQKYSGKPQY